MKKTAKKTGSTRKSTNKKKTTRRARRKGTGKPSTVAGRLVALRILRQTGNSLALTIPANMVNVLQWKEGDTVQLETADFYLGRPYQLRLLQSKQTTLPMEVRK